MRGKNSVNGFGHCDGQFLLLSRVDEDLGRRVQLSESEDKSLVDINGKFLIIIAFLKIHLDADVLLHLRPDDFEVELTAVGGSQHTIHNPTDIIGLHILDTPREKLTLVVIVLQNLREGQAVFMSDLLENGLAHLLVEEILKKPLAIEGDKLEADRLREKQGQPAGGREVDGYRLVGGNREAVIVEGA